MLMLCYMMCDNTDIILYGVIDFIHVITPIHA